MFEFMVEARNYKVWVRVDATMLMMLSQMLYLAADYLRQFLEA